MSEASRLTLICLLLSRPLLNVCAFASESRLVGLLQQQRRETAEEVIEKGKNRYFLQLFCNCQPMPFTTNSLPSFMVACKEQMFRPPS